MVVTVVPGTDASTRTGSFSRLPASSATSGAMVAENSAVWRFMLIAAVICRTGLMKPMSSMRSASSSTSHLVWSSRTFLSVIRSVRRPGVAITTSTPPASLVTWAWRETPPSTSTVETRIEPASSRITSSICTASSRVGARISACVLRGSRRPSSLARPARIGSTNAAVLPEPVWAMPRMSRPASCGGMAFTWIGVGTLKPAFSRPLTRPAERPSSVKF